MTHYKLHPDLVDGIKRAHFDYSYEDTAWQEQFGTSKFVPFEYSTHMNTILRIHQTNDVTYELGTL
jgi:phosphonate transport system substrate-binding protein